MMKYNFLPYQMCFCLIACGSSSTKKETETNEKLSITVASAIPSIYKKTDDTYPLDKCLPLQLRSVNERDQGISTNDFTVTIKSSGKVSLFEDKDCTRTTSNVTLVNVGALNLGTIYFLSTQDTQIEFKFSSVYGNSSSTYKLSK